MSMNSNDGGIGGGGRLLSFFFFYNGQSIGVFLCINSFILPGNHTYGGSLVGVCLGIIPTNLHLGLVG